MDTLGFVRAQKDHTENLPSAVQFRMGGCKGVLVVDPKLGQEDKIVIRPSMEKFKSDYCRLETISFSKPRKKHVVLADPKVELLIYCSVRLSVLCNARIVAKRYVLPKKYQNK